MARPVDPNAQYRVKLHNISGYMYASTQPPTVDPDTGKKKYRYIHWGTIDENQKFIPGAPFFAASPEERARLIFPAEWDMSEVEQSRVDHQKLPTASRAARGGGFAEIRWDRSKERLSLVQKTEVVVHTHSNKTAVFYRAFPGKMPDSKSLTVIRADLEHAGFNDLVLVTDKS